MLFRSAMKGTALGDLGRWDEAIRAYEAALGLAPGSPDIVVALARALARALRREEARLRCQEALAVAPRHTEALTLMAELSLGEGPALSS